MAPKSKRPSVFDRMREQLRRLLDELGPLLNPGKLQPKPIPIPPSNSPRRRPRA
jgi:hypothetical protein